METTRVICNICHQNTTLRTDGSMRSHHPPFNGIGTIECKGSHTIEYRPVPAFIPPIKENKKRREMTAEDFKKIQQQEFKEFRQYKEMAN